MAGHVYLGDSSVEFVPIALRIAQTTERLESTSNASRLTNLKGPILLKGRFGACEPQCLHLELDPHLPSNSIVATLTLTNLRKRCSRARIEYSRGDRCLETIMLRCRFTVPSYHFRRYRYFFRRTLDMPGLVGNLLVNADEL